jgi:hypothetical protein
VPADLILTVENAVRKAFHIVMRVLTSLLGLLFIFMGGIWMMQGLGIGPDAIMRGFMVGDARWTVYGALLALFGAALVAWSNMRRRA